MINAHPALPDFDLVRPASLAEACRFLAEHPDDAHPFMGGTDAFVRLRDGAWEDRYLVDVKCLDGMRTIAFDPADGLTLGAAVTMNQVIASSEVNQAYPLLAESARSVGSYPLRSRATVVGNLCNASPAGDTTGACLVYEAALDVQGVAGVRTIPLRDFFRGPGQTSLSPGDIVTRLHLSLPPRGQASRYLKLGRNALSDLALVGVTVLGFPDSTTASGLRFRLALASVAPVPLIPEQAQSILAAGPVTEALIDEAAGAAMNACNPIDDVRGSARYRRLMVRNLTRIGLTDVWRRLPS
jgi:carbon-monoxide dehydrogenase medium subunit